MASSSAGAAPASVWPSSSARRSASARGANSTTSAPSQRRTPAVSRATRSAPGSAERHVATSTTGTSTTLWARKTTRSSVETSAQWRSSNTTISGLIAARSDSNASTDSNTCNCEPRTSSLNGFPSGRNASTNGWNGSSTPTRSIDRPSSTSKPLAPAAEATSAANRVLPMPASPVTSTVVPWPAPARSRRSTTPASSGSRPTKTPLPRVSMTAASRTCPVRLYE